MDISGEYDLPVGRERVWEALNDPAVLQASIPGANLGARWRCLRWQDQSRHWAGEINV